MDEKTELLICIGSATAANCVPCFEYYFKKALALGITSDEIRKAVELACKLKTGAGIVMRKSIRDITGQDWGAERTGGGEQDHPCCR